MEQKERDSTHLDTACKSINGPTPRSINVVMSPVLSPLIYKKFKLHIYENNPRIVLLLHLSKCVFNAG